ncbi:ABC transporter ATP-binding protein [Bosea lathyri]|jgi:branched-chain amino acid transport system ATP-binding protein|uniref:Amino acid/amide ABC transporter ATP-binding protein 2, HAAT family (TC 3.A.1.4.-) n=1 Tax=Bosea lathyri TaxID=1036778 RepID=A0A1H5UVS6_9HYPH|nr:ABC transporter ATP-binding protein [Bosea lathyri]SEF78538.1 amino acid/amide ABC transporter ATP-binding protein 2, HAAT family (TC 3.A.1.4.-) [Bosea lathyri]
MSLLSFHDVHALYGQARILNGVSFDIGAGERVALVGRNGVGKTTVVNTLCGVTRIERGHVAIRGKAMRDLQRYTAAQNGISVVLQGRGIITNLTVEENLLLGAATGRRGPWSLASVKQLFPILEERKASLGLALSGGQQQMLAIGRALMANPDLLILDEPSEGLAPVIVDELAELLVRLGNDGMGILLIEQSVGLIRRVAERFYVLSKGAVAASGPLADIGAEEFQQHIAI